MLSYQHHYHIGNHADVLKHWLLFETLTYMQRKDKPFDYIDTHSGAGLYQLGDQKTQKLKEYQSGINRLIANPISEMQGYIDVVAPFLKDNTYPGSCLINQQLQRRSDRSWLYELHPATFEELKTSCLKRKKVFCRQEDGFKGLLGLLPNQFHRAVTLIDPSYEIKQDYQQVAKVLQQAYKRMPNVVALLWYPIVNRTQIDELEHSFIQSELRNVQLFELSISDDTEERGMTGSGMIVVNPPWNLKAKAETALPELSKILSDDNTARYRVAQLINE